MKRNYIIIHHSVTSLTTTRRDFIKEDNRYNYNFIISGESKLWYGESLDVKNAHTVADRPEWSHISFNEEGIGICIVGDFTRGFPSDKQVNETCYLIKRLQVKYSIPDENILGHKEVSYTECPGIYTMDMIRKRLR